MTEQQACTLCGAGGHTAAQCKWGESLELLGDIIAMAASDSDDSSFESLCRKYLSEASVPYAVLEDTILGRARDFLASQQGEQATSAENARVHPEQAEGAQGEREAFETWFLRKFYEGDRSCGLEWLSTEPCGGYRYRQAAELWEVWQARAALAQPSPAPELERPEVVGTVVSGPQGTWAAELKYIPVNSGRVDIGDELVLAREHGRIVGALRADRDSWEQQAADRVADWDSMRQERDAAQARVAELEKQEPVGFVRVMAGEPSQYSWHQGVTLPEGKHHLYAAPVAQAGHVPEQCGPGIYAIHYLDNWDGQSDRSYLISEKTPDGRWICHENGSELLQYKGDAILSAWPLAASPAQGGE